ncbi:histidine kinase [Streptomyces kronopolitis]|uniref:sensor histidine kinase n=1 Tax=Streptomyces kronopolitis TaxID=1612435 RepID=UPI0034231B14
MVDSWWTAWRTDAAVVVAVVALDLGNFWAEAPNGLLTGMPRTVIVPMVAVAGLLLWWRRRFPRAVAAGVVAGDMIAFTPAALAVAMYTLGSVVRGPRVLAAFALLGCATDFVAIRGSLPHAALREAVYSMVLTVSPLVAGYAVAVRRDFGRTAQARLEGLEREHQLRLEGARTAERARIAREMHDVVAHRVSSMVLTAGALRVGPASRDPAVATAADRIGTDGRHALEELREVLGVLMPGRHTTRPCPEVPRPGAVQLTALVKQAADRGQQVELRVDGFPEALPWPVQRALYRTGQEALTNAAKYAPGAAVTVALVCRVDGVHLTVTNTASTRPAVTDLPSGGNGLVGLAERARLLGGTLTAGPTDDHGFAVALTLPTRTMRP